MVLMLVHIINNEKQHGVCDELYLEADSIGIEGNSDKNMDYCDVWVKRKQFILENATVQRDDEMFVISGRLVNVRSW